MTWVNILRPSGVFVRCMVKNRVVKPIQKLGIKIHLKRDEGKGRFKKKKVFSFF